MIFLRLKEEALPQKRKSPQRRKRFIELLCLFAGCCVFAVMGFVWGANESSQQETFRYNPGNRRDPFLPLVRDGRMVGPLLGPRHIETSTPVLYGILWDPGGHSIAMINDKELKVGDTYGGYRVMEIRKDSVVLSDGGEPLVLQISFETPGLPSDEDATGGEQR